MSRYSVVDLRQGVVLSRVSFHLHGYVFERGSVEDLILDEGQRRFIREEGPP